jgi:dTDP-4-dehydrorhamnose reductase
VQYVVFGVNGYIGSYIFRQLEKENLNVLGTSRKFCHNNRIVYFDILKDHLDNVITKTNDEDKIAIICIAETNIDRCYENYNRAYEINVIKTKELIQELLEKGFRIIYFSSDCVFDGISGGYTEGCLTNATNKYGLMKAEMERYLLINEPKTCILRIPKVVSIHKAKQNLLTEWTEQISNGYIRCIRGNKMSFVYIDDIYQACLLVASQKMHGIYNIAGDIAYSRAELARRFFDKLGITEVEIRECDLDEFSFKDYRPLNLGMSNLKFKTETKYQFTDMDFVLDKYIEDVIQKKY